MKIPPLKLKKISLGLSMLLLFTGITQDFGRFLEAFAFQSYYKSDLSTEPSKIDFIGRDPGEQFGAGLASCDVNGDGFDDLVVGSPFFSSFEKTWNGKISVFLGSSNSSYNSYDLKQTSPDMEIYGRHSGDQLGMSIACGNFNGDKYDDILIGSYNASSNSIRPGKAFLILGKENISYTILDLSSGSANVELSGDKDGDAFGMSIAMADINHDGIEDLLIGAPFAMSTAQTELMDSGNVYVFFGSKNYVDSVDTLLNAREDSNMIFYGNSGGERFGSSIEVGNFIDNAFDDVAIGAYFADGEKGKQVGKIYIYTGQRRYKKIISNYDDVLEGITPYGWFGFALTSGKINNSSFDDLLISSFPYSDRSQKGKSFVFFGRDSFTESENLDESTIKSPYFSTFDNSDYVVTGGRGESLLGASIGIGDFDGDGFKDFVIGAPGISNLKSTSPGELYFYYGGKFSNKMPMDVKNDDFTSIIIGDYPDDWFGAKISILDFNNDGYDDIAVSSRYFDRRDSETGKISEYNNGKVTILFGNSSPFGTLINKPKIEGEPVTRGEFVLNVVDKFKIKETKQNLIESCYANKESCFYSFTLLSNFDGIKLESDVILYPDVSQKNKYYESVNIATLLGVVSGFTNEKNSPFKPNEPITRIQALKILLGINQLVKPMQRFELANNLGSEYSLFSQKSFYKDVNPSIPSHWWYPRLTNFVYENNLAEDKINFRPDDILTKTEMKDLIDRTLGLLQTT